MPPASNPAPRRLAPPLAGSRSAIAFVAVLAVLGTTVKTGAQTRFETWTTDNGLPQNSVTGLTRTSDGYLWLTTQEGLVRFDGFRFTVFNRSNTPAITTNRMFGAFADQRGRIWMNTDQGEILVYEKGAFSVAQKAGEVPTDRSRFFNAPGGSVIFDANRRDYRQGRNAYQHYHYHHGAFVPLSIDGISEDDYLVAADREGGLWFASGRRLRRFKNGETAGYDVSDFGAGALNSFAFEDSHGSLWLGFTSDSAQRLLRIRKGRIDSFPAPFGPLSAAAEDSHGDLWVSLFNKGIYRIDRRAVVGDALTGDALEPVLLTNRVGNIGHLVPDREGGMWLGTDQALVRMAPQTIRTYSTRDGLADENVYPIFEDRAGRIWAGIWQNSLVRYEHGRFTTVLKNRESSYPTALFEDRSGRLWLGTIGELFYLDGRTLLRFTGQAGFSGTGNTEFSAITEDSNGNLWFGTSLGLSRYAEAKATVFTKKDGLPDDYVIAVLPGRDGTLWVGTRGGLAAIANGRITTYTVADGLASNYIRSLYEDTEGVLWIGSYDGGLTRFARGKFSRFTMKDGLSSDGVFCILEDDRGWFWFNSNQGIYRVRKQQLNDFAEGRTPSLTSIAYTRQDGLLSTEGNGGRQPAGIKARDGTLWFPTAKGIAVVNPAEVITNELPPPVLIENLVVDGKRVPADQLQPALEGRSAFALHPRLRSLEIGYTGISFVNSSQVRFKYKLDDLDRDWNDVGTRRAAYYSYLPPGDYTFRVAAANRDGVWNESGAALKFSIAPAYYQTRLFQAVVAGCAFGLLWLGYRVRVRQVARNYQRRLDERLNERTRIAREIHDTLLQSFHGLLLRFQTAAYLLPARPTEAKARLDDAIVSAAQALTEGRDAVQGLRASTVETNDLARAIRTLGDELAGEPLAGQPPAFDVVIEGRPRALHPIVRDDIYKIAAEALRNAFRHAGARRIEVELHYEHTQLRVRVRDDGKGIDPTVLAQQEREGHYGLRGMSERAEAIAAKLAVWSEVGTGTEVELRVPSTVVYAAAATSWRWSRLFPSRWARAGDQE